jgi:GNAT superfamily N-acetyltransferase
VDISVQPVRDESMLREAWTVGAAAQRHDLPWFPPDPVEEMLHEPMHTRSVRRERWLACRDGRPAGELKLAFPLLDNLETASVSLSVEPGSRRQGVGWALWDTACRRTREEGRTRIVAEVAEPLAAVDGSPGPGAAFATAAGASRVLAEICRVLELADLDDDRLAALEREARGRSAAYDVVQWVGPAPDALVDDLARLQGRLTTDAPLGDLEWEPEHWDVERFREAERAGLAKGRRWVSSAARDRATGRLVAYSDMGFAPAQPEVAYQWTTIVDAAHRGRRLGLRVKAANLALLRQESPVTVRVLTWNAESNQHVIAINDAMGFRPQARWAEWQLSLTG